MKHPPHEIYFASRAISASWIKKHADTLRFHPNCPCRNYRFPAVVALIRNVITSEPTGIHRIFLRDDGTGKREMPDDMSPKQMLGRAKDGAVMLGGIANGHLGIAEGVETALSAAQIFKVTTWAALSAGGIADFPILPSVKFLRIFADHDQAGISAARKCRRRYKAAGIEVEVRYPPTSGTDWNCFLTEENPNG